MFSPGEKVFYPFHGAGEIVCIEEREILGEKTVYYIIRFPLTETTIMIPVEKGEAIGLRKLSSVLDIKKCFEVLKKSPVTIDDDWKVRYKQNQDLLKSGKIEDIAMVVKILYTRNCQKELSTTEKKLYQSAFNILISEISLALDKTVDEVKTEILNLLAPNAS